MNIVVTGSNGFIAKNLVAELKNQGFSDLFLFTRKDTLENLNAALKTADFVFHLAGVNRPVKIEDFKTGNVDLTKFIVDCLEANNPSCSILLSSSTQATLDNAYGRSKKEAEDLIFDYHLKTQSEVYVYRLPNVFGKWSLPNYNTVVATYCYNIARDIPIQIINPEALLNLVYVDDVMNEWLRVLKTSEAIKNASYCIVEPVHQISLQGLSNTLYGFKNNRQDYFIPDFEDPLTKKLYSTYLSFLPEDSFTYPLKMNVDFRGSFTEFIKTETRGQVSINVAKPGIVKGNHWHHTKNEKFLVVSGCGIIRFRKVNEEKVIEVKVSSESLEVVDIPCGYIHNIENTGTSDLVTVMWANETLDPHHPDTYFEEV